MTRSLRPRDIAQRWCCSEQHVRALIRSGRLPYFRIGAKLLRVSLDAVEAIECQNSAQSFTAGNITPSGEKEERSNAGPFVPKVVKPPSARREH